METLKIPSKIWIQLISKMKLMFKHSAHHLDSTSDSSASTHYSYHVAAATAVADEEEMWRAFGSLCSPPPPVFHPQASPAAAAISTSSLNQTLPPPHPLSRFLSSSPEPLPDAAGGAASTSSDPTDDGEDSLASDPTEAGEDNLASLWEDAGDADDIFAADAMVDEVLVERVRAVVESTPEDQIPFALAFKVLGRLASQIAVVLQGKDKPTYAPHDRDRKLRIFSGNEHSFHDRPLEPFVMPPRQVQEMRPRARRALLRAQKKEQDRAAASTKDDENAKNAKSEITA
uniref:Uncharacterized protein n=1 Tax=Oryza nivara TaxID=4536 RepID=A0A0E0HHD6_ORYNI